MIDEFQYTPDSIQTEFADVTVLEKRISITGIQFQRLIDSVIRDSFLLLELHDPIIHHQLNTIFIIVFADRVQIVFVDRSVLAQRIIRKKSISVLQCDTGQLLTTG